MRLKAFVPYLAPVLSAFLYLASIEWSLEYIGLIFLVPSLYVTLSAQSWTKAFLIGMILGVGICSNSAFWMIDGIKLFSSTSWIGWASYAIVLVFAAIMYGVIILLFYIAHKYFSHFIWRGLFYSATVALWEMLFAWFFASVPIFVPHIAYAFFHNISLIQHAEWGGMFGVSLLGVFINTLMLSFYLYNKKSRRIQWLCLGLIAFFMLSGRGLLLYFKYRAIPTEWSGNIATISPEFKPEDAWNSQTGDKMIKHLLTLCRQAYRHQPDFIIWTEGVVPWPFSYDDDFIQEIKKINNNQSTIHFIGMETEDMGVKYNSLYALNFKTDEIFRYDKSHLIGIAETPLILAGIPLTLSHSSKYQKGHTLQPLYELGAARFGTAICNEIMSGNYIKNYLHNQNIDLLIVIANNAWTYKSSISNKVHYMSTAYRAVENRVNILMHSNLGGSGLFNAYGQVTDIENDFIAYKNIYKNNIKYTIFSKYKYFVEIVIIILIIASIINYIYSRSKI